MSKHHVKFGSHATYRLKYGTTSQGIQGSRQRALDFLSDIHNDLSDYVIIKGGSRQPKTEITTADPLWVAAAIRSQVSDDGRLLVDYVDETDIRSEEPIVISLVAGIPVVVAEVQEGLFEIVFRIGTPE